jgi:hypothetical protein
VQALRIQQRRAMGRPRALYRLSSGFSPICWNDVSLYTLPVGSGHSVMFAAESISCEKCGDRAVFSAFVHPLGDTPGAHVYNCTACGHSTWKEWRWSDVTQPPQRESAKPVQLQQQQPQPKNDESKE